MIIKNKKKRHKAVKISILFLITVISVSYTQENTQPPQSTDEIPVIKALSESGISGSVISDTTPELDESTHININEFEIAALLTEKNPFSADIAPGQKVMVKFDLNRKSKIGLFLAMKRETAHAVLLDGKGIRIAEGKQIFTELEKGTFYIMLSVPPFLNGTDIKLYLFGQDNRPVFPPDELVRRIIRGGQGKKPVSFSSENLPFRRVQQCLEVLERDDDREYPFTIERAGAGEKMYTLAPGGVIYEPFQALKLCEDGTFILELSAAVPDPGFSAVRNMISLDPAPSEFKYRIEDRRIIFNFGIEREKRYRITINPVPVYDSECRVLINRNPCVLFAYKSKTPPAAQWERGFAVVERYGPQYLAIDAQGVSQLDFRVYKIDPLHKVFDHLQQPSVFVAENRDSSNISSEQKQNETALLYANEIDAYIKTLGDPHYSKILNVNQKNIDLKPVFNAVSGKESPGAYLVGINHHRDPARWSYARVDVTDLCLSTVETKTKALFAVTNFSNRKSVSDATVKIEGIVNNKMSVLAEGKTGADGILTLEHTAQLNQKFRNARLKRIVVSKGDDLLIVDAKKSNIVQVFAADHWYKGSRDWFRWLSFERYSFELDRKLRGFIRTERPVYRAQDSVYIKGYVRETFQGKISLPSEEGNYIIRVETPSQKYVDYPVSLSENGSFDLGIVSHDSSAGQYKISLLSANEKQNVHEIARTDYIVEDYASAPFEIKFSGAQKFINDHPAAILFTASYYDGTKAGNQDLLYRIMPHSHSYWPRGYRSYLLSSDERYGSGIHYENDLQQSLIRTDKNGNAAIVIPQQTGIGNPVRYVVEISRNDTNNKQIILAQHTVTALPPFVLGLRAQRHITSGSTISARAAAIKVGNDSLLAGQKVNVKLSRVVWNSSLVDSDFSKGSPQYINSESVEVVGEKNIITEEKPVTVDFNNQHPGIYILELTSLDHLNRSQSVSMELFLASNKQQPLIKPDPAIFEAVTDRNSYEPGQQARILLKSAYQRALVLAVVEKPNGEPAYRWVDIRDGRATFTLDITAQMAPQIPVSFLLMRPRVSNARLTPDGTLADEGKPHTVFNTTWVTVNPVANMLDVKLTHKPAVNADGTLNVTISLKDSQGRAQPGEAALWLVDEAVLSLYKEKNLDPLETFLEPVSSHITVKDSRNLSSGGYLGQDNRAANNFEGKEAAQHGKITAAKTVPYWNPFINIDKNGSTVIKIPMPPEAGNYSLRAIAASGSDRFGTARARISVPQK
ncbi:MAG: hypothetical protein LBI42_02640 [Chitinispirillales bacterium]|jgi:hypothetical protein|nr:hypothetical protein [Chitinispirillales bacterium]